MNINAFFLKSFRLLLFPLSFLYGVVVYLRNFLFDKGIIKSTSFNLPIICVGNLTVGGTGKTPMVEYLINILREQYKIATISRGYRRRTSGYLLADENTTALDIGDEPMQFYVKHPDIAVAVGEERIIAVPQILDDKPETKVIILDDALQHRAIKAGLNILLTDYNNLFTRDFFLPTGDLRDRRASYKRAQIIVVTKCPPKLSAEEKENIVAEIKPTNEQQVFFTAIEYKTPYHIITGRKKVLLHNDEIMLVCGIANPISIKEYLSEKAGLYHLHTYGDHHDFSINDIREIKNRYLKIKSSNKIIITTEKDAMRLLKYPKELMYLPFYAIPIECKFLFDEAEKFNTLIRDFIINFNNKTNIEPKNETNDETDNKSKNEIEL
ncbi:MAG: tetraacyldisaccharide 4'-kinase [Chitinophagaceae bacterium]|jgi:tetraacyldisaccharide 4'-kinase|nr:tetraacyldisaccharide 4'-kinase [Chitinophagaceae bacterium]